MKGILIKKVSMEIKHSNIKKYIMTAVFCSLLSFCMDTMLLLMLFLHPSVKAYAAPRLLDAKEPVVIVIDPGHGGANEGTIENGFQEKSMNMVTATAMYEELLQYDNVQVYMTHTEDTDMSLKERAEFAKQVDADFLFSIHYNASLEHTLFGSEVWVSCKIPYNAYGYQFGYVHQQLMQDKGLFSRGVKTGFDDSNTDDYYGIIRESVALDIPAVIIEHCHVDETRDAQYCNDEEKLKDFGRADALSVARYFGLKSQALGADYSENSMALPDVNKNGLVQITLKDETPPDVCLIETAEAKPEECTIDIRVTAADYDTPLLYYCYSLDGGGTYSPLQPWPESNALTGAYKDTFLLHLTVPEGTKPDVLIRAYNLSDCYKESNIINFPQIFRMPGETASVPQEENSGEETGEPGKEESADVSTGKENSMLNVMPVNAPVPEKGDETVSFMNFLKLCLFLVLILFITVLTYQAIRSRRRRRQRRKR